MVINVKVSPSRLFFYETCNWSELKMSSTKYQTLNDVQILQDANQRHGTHPELHVQLRTHACAPTQPYSLVHSHMCMPTCAPMQVHAFSAWLCPPVGQRRGLWLCYIDCWDIPLSELQRWSWLSEQWQQKSMYFCLYLTLDQQVVSSVERITEVANLLPKDMVLPKKASVSTYLGSLD